MNLFFDFYRKNAYAVIVANEKCLSEEANGAPFVNGMTGVVGMSISYKTLLEKMEIEIRKARDANGEQELKGHLYAVKALAELALEGEVGGSITTQQNTVPEKIQTISVPSQERVKMDDEANGDSLFDF
ncbi:YwdI family protein [Bacillus sp. FJAT-49732]|uniref:YwdI family protein n=1 Tax=Lederbergia citrisecunda TaxID=2833583 RepID=A0A942TND5_9BACI|nr:YwdI family protein [Lederbergia citrisecunda]MBS4200755.1 YwdI family protein [Lederbergia citrisecunda]